MFACVCELVFESLHAIDTKKRKSVTKNRDKACKQNIYRILLSGLNWHFDSDSLGLESFGFGILNCPFTTGGASRLNFAGVT